MGTRRKGRHLTAVYTYQFNANYIVSNYFSLLDDGFNYTLIYLQHCVKFPKSRLYRQLEQDMLFSTIPKIAFCCSSYLLLR